VARTNYYVAPSGGSDSTGNGTIGNPWATVQWALNHITRDAVNGDQINVRAGGTDTLGAALTLATYGTPTAAVPLVIRGYASTANDGGQGVISGGGSVGLFGSTCANTYVVDMRLTNTGAVALPINPSADMYLIQCTWDTSTRNGPLATSTHFQGCLLYGHIGGSSVIINNSDREMHGCTAYDFTGILTQGSQFFGNVVDCRYAVGTVALNSARNCQIIGNTILGNGNTGAAITAGGTSANILHLITNNIVVGFSGVGGRGIVTRAYALRAGHNAFYNNTANYSLTGDTLLDLTANDVQLAADPFVDAAGGNFTLTPAARAALAGKGFPTSMPGLPASVNGAVMGALQLGLYGAGPRIFTGF